jgi:hypothetical protein
MTTNNFLVCRPHNHHAPKAAIATHAHVSQRDHSCSVGPHPLLADGSGHTGAALLASANSYNVDHSASLLSSTGCTHTGHCACCIGCRAPEHGYAPRKCGPSDRVFHRMCWTAPANSKQPTCASNMVAALPSNLPDRNTQYIQHVQRMA